jgi:mannose-6-phosphate isomerase-like protein (cupin superfamily)
MRLLDIYEKGKERKKGQRRLDLFISQNLDSWILYFPPGDIQRMHSHPRDQTYYVVAGRGIMKGLKETYEIGAGKILSIPAHEFYEGSNPYDEPMVLLGHANKPTVEDREKAGGERTEIDATTGKRIVYQDPSGRDQGIIVD